MKPIYAVLAGAACFAVAACGEKAADGSATAVAEAAVKRQPGSWTTKVEIVDLKGPDIKGGEKEQLQAMMNMMGNVSICLTPEAVAAEDISKNIEQMGAQGGDCKFAERTVTGNRISFAATCKAADGGSAKLSAKGTNDATSQDITITSEGFKPDGSTAGEMVMRITGKRTGACKPGDITPPTPKATGATET